MGLETSVNFLGDLNRLWPLGTDQKRYGDNNIRNLKVALQQSFGGFAAGVWVTGTDGGAVNAYTVNPAVLPPSLGAKMTVVFSPVVTNTGASTLNYAGLGVKALKSVSGADLVAGDLVLGSIYAAFYNGTEYRLLSITKNYADQLSFASALPAQSLGFLRSDGSAAAFTTTHTGYAQNEVKGADIASAATINLTTATGNLVHITGTTTITAITIPSGAERTMVFDGVLTLTHNATTLILPNSANITTAAGDVATVRGDGTGNARVIHYQRANGDSVRGSGRVLLSVGTPSVGANYDLLTLFSSLYESYEVEICGLTPSGNDSLFIRLAVAGAVDSGSNYVSLSSSTSSTTATSLSIGGVVLAAGTGINASFKISNTSSTSKLKSIKGDSTAEVGAGQFTGAAFQHAYFAANAVSGFRLFWNTASNFAAVGTVRVYGLKAAL